MPIAAIVRGARAALGAIRAAIKLLQKALGPIQKSARAMERDTKGFSQAARGLSKAAPRIGIRVVGLKELRRELRRLENPATWAGVLREVNRAAAAEALAAVQRLARSQPRIRGSRPRPDRGHWPDYVGSYRVVVSQTSAGIRLGSNTQRGGWFLGSNFGSVSKRQFPGPGSPDHALYKGIEQAVPKILDRYGAMLDDLTRKAFPD